MTGRILQLRRAGRPGCLVAAAIGTGGAGPALGQDDPQKVAVTAQPLTDTTQRRCDPVAKIVYGRDALDKHGDVSLGDVRNACRTSTCRAARRGCADWALTTWF